MGAAWIAARAFHDYVQTVAVPLAFDTFEGWLNLKKQQWPEWWDWELELCPHLLKRMMDRQFNEIDLRKMLNHA